MKKNIIIVIVILIGIITLIVINNKSYALSDNVDSKDWNISFLNLASSIVNGSAYVPDEVLTESTSIKAFDVLVSKKGDYATFTFDIVNSGGIDAKLESLSKLEPTCTSLVIPANLEDSEMVCNNLEYTLTYTKNSKEVNVGDIIKAGSKENVTLHVGLKEDIDYTLSNDVQITLYDMNLIFNQLDTD